MKRFIMALAVLMSVIGCSAVNIDRDFEETETIEQTDSTSRKGSLKKGIIIIHIPPIDPKV